MIAAQRREPGAILLVEAGDALFPRTDNLGLPEAGRARLIMEAMGALHYDAMAVGERDLARGVDELKKTAAELHVPLLAANLMDAAGQHPFPATRMVETPLGKAGIFGITNVPAKMLGSLRLEDPRAAAKATIAELHQQGAAMVVGLFHMSNAAALELADGLQGVDTIVVGHDGMSRVLLTKPPTYDLGQKGRDLMKVTFDVGAGPIEDPSGQTSEKNDAAVLDNTIHVLEDRRKSVTDEQRLRSVDAELVSLRKRRDIALEAARKPAVGRAAHQEAITLDAQVADDAMWAAKVAEEAARDGRTPGHDKPSGARPEPGRASAAPSPTP